MKKRYYILIITLILVINFLMVFVAKNKFSHITQDIVNESEYFSMNATYDKFPKYTDIKDLDALELESDLILKVEVKGKKEYVHEDTLAPVEVKEVIKGAISDDIKIAEPLSISNYNTNANVYGGYVPLIPGKEYIVFLKNTNLKNVYKYASLEFGHFSLDRKESNIYDYSNSSTKKVKDIVFYDFLYIYGDSKNKIEMLDKDDPNQILTIDMSQLKQSFVKLKEQCFNKYHN